MLAGGALAGGALVSSAPTKIMVSLLFGWCTSCRGCTCLKCTNQTNYTIYLIGHFLLGWCHFYSVGALGTSAPPEYTTFCLVGAVETTAPPKKCTPLLISQPE